MADPFVTTVFLRSKPGKEEELAARLNTLARASRADSGVIAYELHRSIQEPNLWFVYERYASEEDFKKHLENPVLRSFLADSAAFMEGALETRRFTLVSEQPPRGTLAA